MPGAKRRGHGGPIRLDKGALSDSGLRDLHVRLGQHELAASQSDLPHHRRKPVANSVGDVEINGRLTNASLPIGNVVGNDQGQVNSNTQIEYRTASIPGGALIPNYATAGSVDAVKASVSGVKNQVAALKRQLRTIKAGMKA